MWKELYANIMSCMRAPPASPATLSDPGDFHNHLKTDALSEHTLKILSKSPYNPLCGPTSLHVCVFKGEISKISQEMSPPCHLSSYD